MDNVNSSNPSLEKILISYSEFERLKNIESEYLKIQSSKSKLFELHSNTPSSTKRSFNQSGEGSGLKNQKLNDSDNSDSEDDIYDVIANRLAKKLQKTKANQFEPQQTSSPLNIEVSSPNTAPPIPFSNPIKKSDENDKFDEKQLLLLIPKGKKKNAKSLLSEFDKRPNELTWNSDGVVFIDQVAVPRSNIYTIFPMLFKKRVESNLIGLADFLKKLEEMKLTFLLHKTSENEEAVGKGSTNATSSTQNQPKSSTPWWYIGP